MNKQAILSLLNVVYEGAKFLVKVMPMVIAIAGGITAVTPHVDENGNQNEVHKVLDVVALNILNSSHDVKVGDLHKPIED